MDAQGKTSRSSMTDPSRIPRPSTDCPIAYYDEFQVWQFLERFFKAQLPLRDVTWRSPANGCLVQVPTLHVQVLEHDHAAFERLDASTSYRAPYIHINFVVCETTEAYKGNIKAKVKAWVDERMEKSEEWLLVYVPVGTQNNTHEVYLRLYSRLAGDFCARTVGDRSCMLSTFEGGLSGPIAAEKAGGGALGVGGGQQEQWVELMTKVKAGIVNTFLLRYKHYDDEVKRIEGLRSALDWDFFQFFFGKESLALMSEQLQLPGDALMHYEELSGYVERWRKLVPVVVPSVLMLFRSREGLAVIDYPVSEFRAKLEDRAVGLLEVQQYLFAREILFLQQMGKSPDIVRRAQVFITQQHQTLQALAPSVKPECAHVWALLSAAIVAQTAEDSLKASQQLGQGQAPQHAPSQAASKDQTPVIPPPLQDNKAVSARTPPLPPPPDEERIVMVSRQLGELLDFCRLRLLEAGSSLLGRDALWRQSVVCMARRELSTGAPSVPTSTAAAQSSDGLLVREGSVSAGDEAFAPTADEADTKQVPLDIGSMLAKSGWIKEATSSVKKFDEHYLRLTASLAKHLERAGRDRSVARLQTERATVLVKVGEFDEAKRLLRGLADGCYRKDGWVSLLSELLRQLAICEKERGTVKAYVGTSLQVLALKAADPQAEALQCEIDEAARTKLSSRLVKPLDLIATTRIKASGEGVRKIPMGSEISEVLWLHLNLKQPLPFDMVTLVIGSVSELRKRRRLGAELGWLSGASGGDVASPASGLTSPRSATATMSSTQRGNAEDTEPPVCRAWRLSGPGTLSPGVNELEFKAPSLPPPGNYVYERLIVHWGNLVLEQDQLIALDNDTVDLLAKNRPPPRRFSLISRSPAKRAVSFSVVPRAPTATLAVLHSPVLPPDAQTDQYRVLVVLETRTDSLHRPVLMLKQTPTALAFTGPASIAWYNPPEGVEEHGAAEEAPVKELKAEVSWDGAAASVNMPDLPANVVVVVTVPFAPLPSVINSFLKGRQERTVAVDTVVELMADFNVELFQPLSQLQPFSPSSPGGNRVHSPRQVLHQSLSSPITEQTPKSARSTSTSSQSDTVQRSSLVATSHLVVQHPFLVTITVRCCEPLGSKSGAAGGRRYFVQALLRSRAPMTATIHECHLRLPSAYRLVQSGNDHLKGIMLSPGAQVSYSYLIERTTPMSPSAGAREAKNKMAILSRYTWEQEETEWLQGCAYQSVDESSGSRYGGGPGRLSRGSSEASQVLTGLRLLRQQPPQTQTFERYFQGSAMTSRGDALRTFLVHAQLLSSEPGDGDMMGRSALRENAVCTMVLSPPGGDVDDRGVVVGHVQNTVTHAVVGVALRVVIAVELTDEARKEAADTGMRLAYEVAAEASDWAVSGLSKGQVELRGDQKATIRCKVVPVRVGMLTCPNLELLPLDVQHGVSPKSRRRTSVRWLGPQHIQVIPFASSKQCRYPLLRVPKMPNQP